MPPRKVKYNPNAVKLAGEVDENVYQRFCEMEQRLKEIEVQVAKETSERLMSSISQEFRSMNLMEFMADPTIDLFEKDDAHGLDDASHETSIPIVDSAVPSGRNTATETRRELITPAGHILAVPSTIHPKLGELKAIRRPYLDEEIAFSVNGSPMILGGNVKQKTIVVSITDKETSV